jgi:hypothetical protein
MLLTKPQIATVVLLAAGVLGAGAGLLRQQAQAQKPIRQAVKEEAPKGQTEVTGSVAAVDAAQQTITLQSKLLLGTKTFSLARDARVYLDDGTGDRTGFREGRLAELTEGASASLRLSAEQKVVMIYAEGPSLSGTLKAVDATAGTVQVTLTPIKGGPAVDKTYSVAATVRVFIDSGVGTDKKARLHNDQLTDLTAGAFVTLKLSGDQKSVGSLRAEGQIIHGTLKAVDAEKSTLTLEEKEGSKTFSVGKDARVLIDESKGVKVPPRDGKLADLTPGAVVTVRLSLDQKSVVQVQAAGASVQGVVKAVDAGKNSLTVAVFLAKGEPPTDTTFALADDAKVWIDGKESKLADLPVESHVTVKLSVNQKTAVTVNAEGSAVWGVVKGTASNDSITLASKLGDQTYAIARGATVVTDENRKGQFTDLIDGTVVSAKLSADGRAIIGTLRAEGPSFQGVVKAVDPNTNTLTLTIGGKNGVGGEDKTFSTMKNTQVVTEINGVPLKLADLRVDKEVLLRMALDQKAAVKITVLGE